MNRHWKFGTLVGCVAAGLLGGHGSAEADGATLRPASFCVPTGGSGKFYSANDGWIGNNSATTTATWDCMLPVSRDPYTRIVGVFYFDDSTQAAIFTLKTKQLAGNNSDQEIFVTSVDDRTYRSIEMEAGFGGGSGEHAYLTISIPRGDSGEVAITGIRVVR